MKTLKYSLNFASFSLDFNVSLAGSIECTTAYQGEHKDYSFAVGRAWLKTEDARRLLFNPWDIYNLMIFLQDLGMKI